MRMMLASAIQTSLPQESHLILVIDLAFMQYLMHFIFSVVE
jgi:hypothetical protein